MSETGLILIFGLFAVIVIFGMWFSWKQERERTEALARLAGRQGWRFSGEGKDRDFRERHGQFDCFQRGHTRYAHNQLAGPMDALGASLDAEAGDYHYQITRQNGKHSSTTTYRFSYLLVALPFGSRLPSLALRTEGLWDKLAGAVGFEDIDFESAEFSRRYHVSGDDRRFVYDLIHPRMIDWMLDDAPPQFELSGSVLLIVSNGAENRWEPEEFQAAINWARTFFSHWPDYLVRDLGAR